MGTRRDRRQNVFIPSATKRKTGLNRDLKKCDVQQDLGSACVRLRLLVVSAKASLKNGSWFLMGESNIWVREGLGFLCTLRSEKCASLNRESGISNKNYSFDL